MSKKRAMPKAWIENAKEGVVGLSCGKDVPLGRYELVIQTPGKPGMDITIPIKVIANLDGRNRRYAIHTGKKL